MFQSHFRAFSSSDTEATTHARGKGDVPIPFSGFFLFRQQVDILVHYSRTCSKAWLPDRASGSQQLRGEAEGPKRQSGERER
jgi:hypothetical protein